MDRSESVAYTRRAARSPGSTEPGVQEDFLGDLWLRKMGEGPLLVALHGGPGLDHTSLLPLARPLASSFEVWLPDLPGHGRSRRGGVRRPGLGQLQRGLAAWLRRYAPRPAVLLGHSLGAWLARDVLRTQSRGGLAPGRLVLLAPPVAGRDPARDGGRSAVRRGVRQLSGQASPRSGSSDAVADVLAHVRDECGGKVPAELRADLAAGRLESAMAFGSLLRNLHRKFTGPYRPFAPPCETLVLAGQEDRTTPADVAARLGDAPRTRVEILPGLGHYLHAQDPETVAARIVAFCGQIAESRR